jgi:hypothetical protein
MYLSLFLVFAFVMQLSINLWASAKVCPLGKSNNVSIGKSLGYTIVPWFLILFIISFILYIMPGWVRVFSNTIGLAVSKSVYYELFTVDNPKPGPVGNTEPPTLDEKKMGGSGTENVQEQTNPTPPPPVISPDVIAEIYHDPSKIINEIEYLPEFDEWYEKIFTKYLIFLPYFNNPAFFNTKTVYQVMGGGPAEDSPSTEKPKQRPVNDKNNIYKLYRCVAMKEKIGYFTWLFLSGAIFTLTSLSQMYSSDC